MFFNPFAGFRDPDDPYGLRQMAAAPNSIYGPPAAPSAVPPPRSVATTRVGPEGNPLPRPWVDPPPLVTPENPIAPTPFPPSPMAPRQAEVATDKTDERLAPLPPTSRKIPEVVTTPLGTPQDERLVPTAASQAAREKSFNEKLMDMYKDPKFAPALAALVKGMGGGAAAPPIPTARAPQIAAGNPGYHQPDTGAGAKLTEMRKGWGQFGPKPKKPRQDDPHQYEQDIYDFRRMRGRG